LKLAVFLMEKGNCDFIRLGATEQVGLSKGVER